MCLFHSLWEYDRFNTHTERTNVLELCFLRIQAERNYLFDITLVVASLPASGEKKKKAEAKKTKKK